MKKRVISMHFTAPPDIGGVEFAAFELALAANNIKNFSGVLLTGTNSKNLPESYLNVERKILPEINSQFPLNRKIFEDFKIGKYPTELESLTKFIYDELDRYIMPGDFIVSFNVFCQPFNIALTAALRLIHERRNDFFHLTWCHDLSIKESEYNWTLRDQYPWELMWSFCPGVHYAVNTKPLAKDLSQLLGCDISSIQVIPVGINIFKTMRISKKIEDIYRNKKIMTKYPVIFIPAKMSFRKNLPKAIHLIDKLREKFEQAHLIIAGSSSPHDVRTKEHSLELKKLIKNKKLEQNVTILSWEPNFNGRVLYDSTVSMMALSDIILFTSNRETFLIPILEACLHGVPILIPKGPEVVSWAKDRALFYERNAPDSEIIEILLKIIESNDVKLKHRTRLEYSWENILNNFILKGANYND